MSDSQEQAFSLEQTPSGAVHPATAYRFAESPRSCARKRSGALAPNGRVIDTGREALDCVEALRPLFTEELAHMRPILTPGDWSVVCQLEGELVPRVICGSSERNSAESREAACHWVPEAVVFRFDGRIFGMLGLRCTPSAPADPVFNVLDALLRHAARSISERWFRLHHREDWIVALAPAASPDQGVVLALDQKLHLRALGFGAAELLGARPQGTTARHWEELFTSATPLPTMRGQADLPVRLTAVRDGRPWIALLSGPDVRATAAWTSDALVHGRPRLHQLTTFSATQWEEPASNAPSLTTGMRRRVEEFIEARLDTPLSVEEIAREAGMSCSYFARAFRNALKMTPHRYLMWRRLVRARELIKTSEASLAEIALVTGFSDQSHLCRLFHEHLGESPRRYRRRWR